MEKKTFQNDLQNLNLEAALSIAKNLYQSLFQEIT